MKKIDYALVQRYVDSLSDECIDQLLDDLDKVKRRPNDATERQTVMWNNNGNGQGNGQGNYNQGGYQQQPQQNYGGGYGGDDDAYNRMNNAREQGGARFPFIDRGKHLLCLAVMEKFQHRTDGPSARVIYEVLQSDVHPVGSFVVKIYKLKKQPKYDSQPSDSELLAQMCIALKGVKAGYPIGNDIRTLLEPAPAGRAEEQLARGTVVECIGVPNQKNTWTNLFWSTVEQTPEQIVQHRQRLEVKGIPASGAAQRGTQGGQYNGAPHPAQMQQGYAPQQAAPQQGYQMPQGQWQQPQGAPPPTQVQAGMPQQGYGQPAAPQGGFLQQVQGPVAPGPGPGPQGPQGGNGGGRPW